MAPKKSEKLLKLKIDKFELGRRKQVGNLRKWIELRTNRLVLKYFLNLEIPFHCLTLKHNYVGFGIMSTKVRPKI